MTSSFFRALDNLVEFTDKANGTSVSCDTGINHFKFYQFSLIPAMILTLLFASTKTRRQKLLHVLGGRPGLIYPMDVLTRTSRLSYACAFGATAFLVYQILLEQRFAFDYNGPIALKTLIALGSMFIYGMVFFPVFACLALGSAFSYGMGTLYVWMFFVVNIYKCTECDLDKVSRILLVMRYLPILLCELYLSLSLPYRFVKACRQRKFFVSLYGEEFHRETVQDVRNSFQGKYVTRLLRKPKIEKPSTTKRDKVKACLLSIIHKVLYQPESGFRYPSRLISVMVVTAIVIYVVTLNLLVTFVTLLNLIMKEASKHLEFFGLNPEPGEDQEVSNMRSALVATYFLAEILRVSLIVSISLSCFISFITILHTMSSFRTNLYAMYRGDYRHIPSPYEKSAVSLCIGSMKYAGFQVGYIVWGFLITCLVLFIICFLLAIVIVLLMSGIKEWLVDIILQVWPGVVVAIVIIILQRLVAKFFFLQEKGQYLRLDNRRFFFVFTYFMFFYNIFLGLLSCLLRILKAMLVGILFLSRLDNSTLPRRFEFFDPGFNAYQGYIHMEAAHTHPVLIVFIRLLAALRKDRQEEMDKPKQTALEIEHGASDTGDHGSTPKDGQTTRPSNVAARFQWLVTYTLLLNPTVRVYRKGFIQAMRKAKKEGRTLPISDKPYTDFDLVKTEEERIQEKAEEVMRIRRDSGLDVTDGIQSIAAMLGSAPANGKAGHESSLAVAERGKASKGKLGQLKGWMKKKTSHRNLNKHKTNDANFEYVSMEREKNIEDKVEEEKEENEAEDVIGGEKDRGVVDPDHLTPEVQLSSRTDDRNQQQGNVMVLNPGFQSSNQNI